MSRWLSGLNQVSNLLEQLDDRVENVAEERAFGENVGSEEEGALDNILAKRGLLGESHDSDDVEVGVKKDATMDSEALYENLDSTPVGVSDSIDQSGEEVATDNLPPDAGPEMKDIGVVQEDSNRLSSEEVPEEKQESSKAEGTVNSTRSQSANEGFDGNQQPRPIQQPSKSRSIPKNTGGTKTDKLAMVASKEAQKEVRGLRRHIVKLNTELEQAEQEVVALRDELNNAAGLMEKEIGKVKMRGEKERKEAADKLEAQRKKYEEMMKEQEAIHQAMSKEYETKIAGLEERRKQDGGDWIKERAEAMEREQDINGRISQLEDEKAVLLSQVSTLQNQQVALGSRLESLSEAAENAMTRAREAEDKLDDTLSLHAKQISQRQTREAELEQNIHELNAALVVAKSGGSNSFSNGNPKDENGASAETSLVRQIHTLKDDLDAVTSQLNLEKERSSTLHAQLKEIAKDTTQEASAAQAKLLLYEREASEMRIKITKLTAELHDLRRQNDSKSDFTPVGTQRNDEQVGQLSEEVLRLRERLADASSATLTLKNKLKEAREKAAEAEEKLAVAEMNANSKDGYEMRSNHGMTRRVKSGNPTSGSIRSALLLNSGQSDQVEKIGKAVDAVDSFAVTTGRYLRRNPLARAGFIFYLLLVHAWSFVLLFFHAHYVQVEGSHGQLGPHSLMMKTTEAVTDVQKLVDQVPKAVEDNVDQKEPLLGN